MHWGVLLMCIFSVKEIVSNSFENNSEYHLLNELFGKVTHELSREVLPLPSNRKPVFVCFQFGIYEILELNEKNQIMRTNIWLRTNWTNHHLKWNPRDFGGIKFITVEKEKVWVPDITLWNRAVDDASMYQRMDTRVRLGHDGSCSWNAPVTTSSVCSIKIKDFPFDVQECNLTLGSWRHSNKEINFSLCDRPCVDRKNFIQHSEWSLDDVYGWVRDESYYGHTEFSTITCGLHVRRKSLFFVINMVVPCAIIAFLCCLTFYLPTNNGERISLVVTVLLAMTVYMLIVAESMPPTSEGVPLVEKFYFISIVETTLCLVGTCIVVKWHETSTPMPNWVSVVFNCVLRKILRVKQVADAQEDVDVAHTERFHSKAKRFAQNSKRSKSLKPCSENILLENAFPVKKDKLVDVPSTLESNTLETNGRRLSVGRGKKIARDWKLASRVLNKFFLVASILMFFVSMVAIFANFISF